MAHAAILELDPDVRNTHTQTDKAVPSAVRERENVPDCLWLLVIPVSVGLLASDPSSDGSVPPGTSWCIASLPGVLRHFLVYCITVGRQVRPSVLLFVFLRERLPTQKAGSVPYDMDQFRMLFCTCKVPGVVKDTILNYFKTGRKSSNTLVVLRNCLVGKVSHPSCLLPPESEGPCPSHVVVMCRGRIFTFDALYEGHILTPPEMLRYLPTPQAALKPMYTTITILYCPMSNFVLCVCVCVCVASSAM